MDTTVPPVALVRKKLLKFSFAHVRPLAGLRVAERVVDDGRWLGGSRSTALTYGASEDASHKLRSVLSFIVRSCVPDICLLPYYMNRVVPDVRVMVTN